jgi:type IV secretion system protein VirB9
VSWRYPHDAIRQLRKHSAANVNVTPANPQFNLLDFDQDELRFDYAIKGDTPNWRPTRVFDDGQKIYIEFPEDLTVSEAPPLFITDGDDKIGKLVNYRIKGEFYIVDRLFDFAELRLGEKDQTIVRIERES